MADAPRKNETGTRRGRPFAAGNPGRPRGSRNKATLAAQALLEGEAAALTRAAIDAALGGDVTALRLCLDRLVPPARERPIRFALPPLATAADAARAMGAVVEALAAGDLTPGEASAAAGLVESFRRALETTELEQRITELEKKGKRR